MSSDYRSYLLREFSKRVSKNPHYSLRAFARDLSLNPSRLSEAINRKCGISPLRAHQVADLMGLESKEKRHFVTMVEAEHSRSRMVRRRAATELEKMQEEVPEAPFKIEWIRYFSSWHHTALLELAQIKEFKPRPIWIAERLGISVVEAREALSLLLFLGLFKEVQGKVVRADGYMATPTDIPSEDLRRLHSAMLKKADSLLSAHTVDERDIATLVLPIDSRKMKEAKAMLKQFRRKFCRTMMESTDYDRVYSLSVQFFPLDLGDVRK